MSTASMSGPYPTFDPSFNPIATGPKLVTPRSVIPNSVGLSLRSSSSTGLDIRRRTNFQQGRALEILGHAIEYLIDSRMFLVYERSTSADAQALQTLMLLSRYVFAGCAESIPPTRRLRLWVDQRLNTPTNC